MRLRNSLTSGKEDWTHIDDMVRGYRLLAEKGEKGQAYNIGSERTNSAAALQRFDCADIHACDIEAHEYVCGN